MAHGRARGVFFNPRPHNPPHVFRLRIQQPKALLIRIGLGLGRSAELSNEGRIDLTSRRRYILLGHVLGAGSSWEMVEGGGSFEQDQGEIAEGNGAVL